VGLLRLFIVWRLLRLCVPLILTACLLLAVSSWLRGVDHRFGRSSTSGSVSRVQRAVGPLIREARRDLTSVLLSGRSR
jgi:hypothetical protein